MKHQSSRTFGFLTLTLAMASPAFATSDSWKANASGNWNSAASWTAGNIPGSTSVLDSTDIATFGFTLATSGKTVTVDANRNIGGIIFSNTSSFGYTLSGGSLKLSGNGVIQSTGTTGAHTDTISTPIEIQGDGGTAAFTNSSTLATRLMNIGAVTGASTGSNVTNLILNGGNTGANALSGIVGNGSNGGKLSVTKNDAGTWSLQNNGNTYSGGTTVNAGTLQALTAGSLGTGQVTLAGGALHLINNANTAYNNNVSVTGNATISSTKVSGQTGNISHTLGTLEIGASTLTVAKFFNTNVAALTFGPTTLTGVGTFNTTFTNATNQTTLTLGAVTGGLLTGITKTGTGTLILAANNPSYSGATQIDAGTLQVGAVGATGDLGSGTVTIAAAGTLAVARNNSATITNAIGGAGSVRVASGGSAVITLTNASHTGATLVENGILHTNNFSSNIVLGTVGSTFTYPALGLQADFTGGLGTGPGQISWAAGNNTSGGFAVMDAVTRVVNIGGNATPDTLTLGSGGFVGGTLSGNNSRLSFGDVNGTATGTVDFRNSINLGDGTRSLIVVANGTALAAGDISGNIIGSGLAGGTDNALVKFGSGNLRLSGTNSYTGRTLAGGEGSVILGSAGAFSPNTWIHLGGGTAGTLGGILGLGAGDLAANLGQSGGQIHFAASGGFAAFGGNRSVTLNGGAGLVWASTTSFVANNENLILGQAKADGTLTLTNDIDLNAGSRTIHVNNGAAATDAELAGGLTGTGASLVKSGAGTLLLTGTSTYDGTTTVSAGTLLVNGTLGATAVTAASSAVLGGSGTIGGSVTVNGTLAPGSSIESLGTGNLSLAATSTYAYQLDSSALAGDLTYASGTLDIASGSVLTLDELASGTLAVGSKLTLISYHGSWNNGLFTYLGETLNDDSSFLLGSNLWQFNYNDTAGGSNFAADQLGADRFVTMSVIPETATVLLIFPALGSGLLRRRRRA